MSGLAVASFRDGIEGMDVHSRSLQGPLSNKETATEARRNLFEIATISVLTKPFGLGLSFTLK